MNGKIGAAHTSLDEGDVSFDIVLILEGPAPTGGNRGYQTDAVVGFILKWKKISYKQ